MLASLFTPLQLVGCHLYGAFVVGFRRFRRLPAIALLAGSSMASGANIIHEFYVPLPEAQARTALVSIEPASGIVGTTIESVVSIVATGSGTVIHYDQWEDGYEVDLNNPTQSTTQIWGDGNNANGKPPGYANDPASFASGAVIVMRNQIPLPRNAANLFYDGRDRFGGTKALVVSRANWATTPGTVLCGANEVMATMDYGTSYVAPVGDDVSANSMFEFVGLFVMARDDGTSVSIDVDGAGAGAAMVVALNRGESYLVNGGIKKGATVTSNKPVQAHLITGDIGARYESRRFTLYPTDQWSSTMYAPLGTASNGVTSYAFIYNPGTSALTVNVLNNTGASSFSVPAKGVVQHTLAKDSGTRFKSASDEPFTGVVTVGASPSANNVHDWGFTMLPSDNLTTEAVVGWGPGSSDGTQNGSPAWVTPVSATRIYVDYNGDRLGSQTDPKGDKYDVHYDVSALTTKIVYDPDKDQTAMRLYTLDGVAIAAAWGQDPSVAGAANPFLDCGTTVLPFPVPVLKKSSKIVIDNGTAGLTVSDVLEYSITVDNRGLLPLGNLLVLDPLHTSLAYVAGSTSRDGASIADGTSGTAFPLDESGYTVPLILRSGTTTFKYQATVTGTGSIVNTASNPAYNLTVENDVVVPPGGGSTPCVIMFTNNGGVDTTAYSVGSNLYATLTDPDSNRSSTTVESVIATITNAATGDIETITLVETGVNTGVFRNATALPTSGTTGAATQNGILYVVPGNTIDVTHLDSEYGETCSDSAVISVPTQSKYLYLTDTLALDRTDPVAAADGTTASTASLYIGSSTITAAATTTGSSTTGTTLSFSHTPGTGANRLLLVSVGVGFNTNNGDAPAVTGVTFGGTAMTLVGTVIPSTTQGTRSYIYQMVNPPSAAANVVVTTASTASMGAGATTFVNVHQTTPLGVFASASSNGATAVSTNVTSAVGELVYSIGSWDEGSANEAVTSNAGQTELWNLSGLNFVSAAASTKPGAAGTVTVGYTATDNQECVVGGVSIKPAPVVSNTQVSFTQAPTFASSFTLPVGASPVVQTFYTVGSGTMPGTPSITAVLKKGAATVATSSATSASGGALNFTFPALGSAQTFAAGEAMTLEVTTAQTGVDFTINYDSTSAPSKITLPTTTVIGVNSLDVYDAPYPGGSPVSLPSSGTTVYVRSTASDPFGHADITSMGLSIDGPGTGGDVSTTLGAGQVVATATGTKTYEYAWAVGLTTGAYNIAVTANEGSEGIQATRSIPVTVTQMDLGTPSTTEFTTGSNGPGTPTYAGNETVYVRVTDLDQNTNAAVAETVAVTITSASGDSETITLTETGVNTGIFVAGIPASTTLGTSHNGGTLHAILGEVLQVVYVDPDDSSDTSNDTATIPDTSPSIFVDKTLVSPADGQAVVGEEVEYSVQVTNTGNSTLSTITLTDTFPADKLAYATSSVAPNTVGSGSLAWTNIGPLTQGQSVTLHLTFTALASAAPAVNTASANAGGGVTGGDTANVTITNPSVLVTKTVTAPLSGTVNVGDQVTYSINIQNTGDTEITSLPVEDLFSGSNFEFVSATPTPDATGSGSLLWVDITGAGNLSPTAATTIQVVLRAKGGGTGATNSAEVNYAVDEHGDPVPPSTSTVGVTVLSATIRGTVYEDMDTDGILSVGDVGIEDVTVSIYTDPNGDGNPADGVVFAITTTNGTGAYEFDNLPANQSFVVIETDPYGYASTGDTAGANDNRIPVTVTSTTTYADNDFFDYLPDPADYVSISGTVWNDTDLSGTANGGETGLANVTITLVQDVNGNGIADVGEPVYDFATTDVDGDYSFTFVPPGSYVIRETDPSGYASTGDTSPPNNNMIPVVAAASDILVNQDFLDVLGGTITGRVYEDTNGDGDQDVGEPGVPMVDMLITDVAGGQHRATTDSNGNWSAFVPPGSASVIVDRNSIGFTSAFDHYPSLPFTLPSPEQTEGNDPTPVVAVAGTSTSAGNDGFFNATYVYGRVFLDLNGDGNTLPDLAEQTPPSVPVTITDTTGIPQTVMTDSLGNWVARVVPGAVTVAVDEVPGNPAPGTYTQTVGADPTTITAAAAQMNDAGNDAYFVQARVTGRLYVDVNGNGSRDAGDTDLAGVDVLITKSDTTTETVTTDSNGVWSLLVPAGTTAANVVETDPQFTALVLTNAYQTYVHTEGDDPTSTNALLGVDNAGGDDGYFNPTVAYGHVFFDQNGNGVQDIGEPDLAFVDVLVTDNNGTQTVSTNASGDWEAVVVPGTTTADVQETDADFVSVIPVAFYLRTVGSDPSSLSTPEGVATFLGNDGYFIPATVTGRLYLDINGDGDQDSGEPGLPDVDVLITDSTGHEQTVTTDSNGNWSVLVLGGNTTANVDETDLDFLAHVPTGSPKTQGDDPTMVTAVVNSSVSGGIDGWTLAGTYSITGQVRDDIDEDGVLTDNDTPVPGVTVKLWLDFNGDDMLDSGDALIDTTTTDLLGNYTFTGLPNGRYLVQEINPQGATSTADSGGANDDLIPVLIAGASSVADDFLDAVDPSGYAYDTVTGQIIAGGSISVSGPGAVTILMDGTNGQYSFLTDGTAGSYTITYTPPAGYIFDPTRPVAGASFDPTGGANPTSLGSDEDPLNPGYMTDKGAGANPYYLTFELESGDPLVINNNIPLRLQVPKKYVYWKEITPGGGPNPNSNGDGDCYSDIIEYALNLNPATGVQTAPVFRGVHNPLTGKVDVSFNRVAGGLVDITYSLEGLHDLTASPGGWTALTLVPTITPNGDGTETVTYADVESDPFFTGRTDGLVRLKVDYDADADTVADATAGTPVFGWNRRTFNAECVMTGHPYLKPKVFCGTVDSMIIGGVIDVTSSVGASSVAAQFTPGREYFMEVYSGDNPGQRFEINESGSSATQIVLDLGSSRNTMPVAPADLIGDKVVVREHWAIDDLFNKDQFTATTNPTTGDRLLFYDPNTNNFRIYWLLDHVGSGTHRWILTGDASLTDRGGRVIDSPEGWYTHPKGGAQQVVWCGMVRANAFAAPLRAGTNFIGSGYPMNQSPSMRGMTIANGFTGNRDPSMADQLLFWKGYNTDQTMAYYNHFLLSAGAIQRWTEQGNALVIDENNLPLFKPTTGSIYKMRTNLPGFVMPMPWTP